MATAPITNLEYPDGFTGLTPVLITALLTTSYTIPAGQNFYITNSYSNNTGASVTINGAVIAFGALNSSYTPVTKPIIAGARDVISASIDQITLNGFLVTAGITPITQGITTASSYMVPAGRTLIVLSVNSSSNVHSSSFVAVDGNLIYIGSGNDGAVSAGNFLTSFHQPLFIGAGSVLTSVTSIRDYNINGYLIDN